MSIILLFITLCVVSVTSGRVHSHHSHKETDDTDLEKALIEKYYQDEDEDTFDEYNNSFFESELDEMDELLADPRPYPRPRPWRWIRRISIGCTFKCSSYNWCVVRKGYQKCRYPSGCNCRRFAWEKS